jgi:hypothetical protein
MRLRGQHDGDGLWVERLAALVQEALSGRAEALGRR